MTTMITLTEEERRILLQLLEEQIRELHTEIHHTDLGDAKKFLKERLALVEQLRKEVENAEECAAAWPT